MRNSPVLETANVQSKVSFNFEAAELPEEEELEDIIFVVLVSFSISLFAWLIVLVDEISLF